MRIGIFSDIHSNLEALEAVLEFFARKGIDLFLVVGDIVGYGANPNECVARVRELDGRVVAGNHDWAAVGLVPYTDFNSAAATAVKWTHQVLSAESSRYLGGLPLTEEYDSLLLAHSTPSAPAEWHYIFTLGDATFEFEHFDAPVCLVGHSHLPFLVELKEGRAQFYPGSTHTLDPMGRYLVNVGSVGQPRDGDARACAVLFDSRRRSLRFFRIAYDVARAQSGIRAAGLPGTLAERLALGR